jgi:hypothetical protein
MTLDDLEMSIGSKLPDDYREFLGTHRESQLPCTKVFPFTEKTPIGEKGVLDELLTLDDLGSNRPVWIEDIGMLIIGDNLFGYPTYVCLKEPWFGHIFYFDLQQRSLWEDEQFHRMFENLADEIKDYLRMRAEGTLPQKKAGFESFYHVANSFSEFQGLLQDEEIEE